MRIKKANITYQDQKTIPMQRSAYYREKGLTDKIHDFLEKHSLFLVSIFEKLFGNGKIKVDFNNYWESENGIQKVESREFTSKQLKAEIKKSNSTVEKANEAGNNIVKEGLKKKQTRQDDLKIIKEEIIPLLKVKAAGVLSDVFNKVDALSPNEREAFQIFQDEKQFSSSNPMTNKIFLEFFEYREKSLKKN